MNLICFAGIFANYCDSALSRRAAAESELKICPIMMDPFRSILSGFPTVDGYVRWMQRSTAWCFWARLAGRFATHGCYGCHGRRGG